MEQAPPVLATVEPSHPQTAPPRLLFVTHRNVSNVENEIDYYRPVTEWGWLLAMPQSSQPWDVEGRYVWGDFDVMNNFFQEMEHTSWLARICAVSARRSRQRWWALPYG